MAQEFLLLESSEEFAKSGHLELEERLKGFDSRVIYRK